MNNCFLMTSTCKKWSTMIGLFLILWPLGVQWYWGNVSIYTQSYLLKYVSSSSDEVQTPWVMSFIATGTCIGLFLSAFLTKFVGKRFTAFFGIALFNAGQFGAYFAVRASPIALDLVYGLVLATSAYTLDGVAMKFGAEWSNENFGTINALQRSAFPSGAIFMNEIITFYINPNNSLPDARIGPSKIFTQVNLVDKVPSVFLLLGCVILPLNITGFLMIRENNDRSSKEENRDANRNSMTKQIKDYGGTRRTSGEYCDLGQNYNKEIVVESSLDGSLPDHYDGNSNPTLSAADQSSSSMTLPTSSLKRVICKPTFYVYCFLTMVGEFSYIILANYYKAYGQTFIKDDHFLTNFTVALLIAIVISRWICGVSLDRLGLKTTLLIYFASNAFASLIFYASQFAGRWLYVVSGLLLGCVANPIYVIMAYACVKTYGQDDFLLNYALITFPTILTNVAIPPFLQYLLTNYGWFAIFATSSGFNLFGLVMSMAALS